MTANPRRRRSVDYHGIDMRDLAARALRALIFVGWFGFVGTVLTNALRNAS